jgi:nicotinamide-nucleotide amidase
MSGRIVPEAIEALAAEALAAARASGLSIVTAESCTGGLVGGALTAVAGSSDVYDGGFVTYSNAAKMRALGVPAETLRTFGAVSPPTAQAMAEGALKASGAALAVAITGIAGPGGGSAEKPVGLVEFAAARRGHPAVLETRRFGALPRDTIRHLSVEVALGLLIRLARQP